MNQSALKINKTEEISRVVELEKELSLKKRELDILYRINRSLASGYLEYLLSLIVNLTYELTECDICSVMILDPKKNELVVRAALSLDPEYIKARPVKVDNSLSGKALLEGRPCQWENVLKEPLYNYHSMAEKLNLKSLLSVPMMVKFRPLGVMNFYTRKVRFFKPGEIEFFQSVANQAAIALERENLTEEVRQSKKILEERKLVEKAKGILIKTKKISEERAYDLLRTTSMTSRKSMAEISRALILADSI